MSPRVIAKVPGKRDLPVSYAQEGLCLTGRLDGSQLHVQGGYRLRGRLEPEALRRAVEGGVGRDESLRTIFPERDGGARQDVLPAGRWELPVEFLSGEEEVAR